MERCVFLGLIDCSDLSLAVPNTTTTTQLSAVNNPPVYTLYRYTTRTHALRRPTGCTVSPCTPVVGPVYCAVRSQRPATCQHEFI